MRPQNFAPVCALCGGPRPATLWMCAEHTRLWREKTGGRPIDPRWAQKRIQLHRRKAAAEAAEQLRNNVYFPFLTPLGVRTVDVS